MSAPIVIVSTVRTPMGQRPGAFSKLCLGGEATALVREMR